jgi:hypothetical protein
MEPAKVVATPSREPFPAESFPASDENSFPLAAELDTDPRVEYIGRVRVSIAGPYRPWARLYRLPDLRLVWVIRLWDRHCAVRRLTSTDTLLEYARMHRMPALAARIRSLQRRGRSDV